MDLGVRRETRVSERARGRYIAVTCVGALMVAGTWAVVATPVGPGAPGRGMGGGADSGTPGAVRPSAPLATGEGVQVPEKGSESPTRAPVAVQGDDGRVRETPVSVSPSAVPSTRTSVPVVTKSPSVTKSSTIRTPKPTPDPAAPRDPVVSGTEVVTSTPRGNTLRIGGWTHSYVSAYGSQRALDTCAVVEWEPMWFAGHDYCGYAFWARMTVGQTVVLTGKNSGTYTVTALVYLPYQGGRKPALPAYDLALQTCKGSGTQLVLARKTG